MSEAKKPSAVNYFGVLMVAFFVISVVATSILFYRSIYGATVEDRAFAAFILMISFVIIGPLLFVFWLYARNYSRILAILEGEYWVRWEYPKETGIGDVYFYDEGFYESGRPYKPLDTFGAYLLSVEIPLSDPSVIRFNSKQFTSTAGIISLWNQTHDVEIPAGKEDEAVEIVKRFSGHHGRRSSFTRDQWPSVLPVVGATLLSCFLCYFFLVGPAGFEMKLARDQRYKEDAEARLKAKTDIITMQLDKIKPIIEPQLEKWKTLPDGNLSAKEAGFDENSEVLRVLYGRCVTKRNEFYVSVVLKKIQGEKSGDHSIKTGVINYTTTRPFPPSRSDSFCRSPLQQDVLDRIYISGGWLYGEVEKRPYLPKSDAQATK